MNYSINRVRNKFKITVKRSRGTLNLDDIKTEGHKILTQYDIKDSKMYVRGLSTIGYSTIKSYNSNMDFEDDAEEYLDRRVRDPRKFDNYYQAEFTVFSDKDPVVEAPAKKKLTKKQLRAKKLKMAIRRL